MEIQAILIRIDDTQDKCFFQYIHANDSTPIIYVKICGTLHPFSLVQLAGFGFNSVSLKHYIGLSHLQKTCS